MENTRNNNTDTTVNHQTSTKNSHTAFLNTNHVKALPSNPDGTSGQNTTPNNDDNLSVDLRKTRRNKSHSCLNKSKAFCKTLSRLIDRNIHSLTYTQHNNSHLQTSNNNLSSFDRLSQRSHDSLTDVLKANALINIPVLLRARQHQNRIILNVGGERHEVMWKTLKRLPLSRLGRLSLSNNPEELVQLFDDYSTEKNELYFDRYARSFGSILGLYRTGHLHLLEDICVLAFKSDLYYWGINEYQLETCCFYKYYQKKEQVEEEFKKTREISMSQAQEEQFGTGKWATIQKYIWDLVEKPQTSMAARIFAVISIAFIMLSIIGLNLSTIPELRGNSSAVNDEAHNGTHTTDDVNEKLEMLESVCTIWFTFEYALRLLVAPNKCAFMKSPMNLIDVIAILPYYFSEIFEVWLHSPPSDSLVSMRKIVQMFRILRILRVFKLARHSQGLQALGYTLKQSYKELGLLMLFVVLVVLLFSSLAYFAEKDDNKTEFQSIPATFWWAIITMTTVGYGDITPKTVLGKVIGSVCCICGVLVVGLPIPIIVNNFAAFYQDQMRREKVMKRQEARDNHGGLMQLGNTDFLRKSSTEPPKCQSTRLISANMFRNRHSLSVIRSGVGLDDSGRQNATLPNHHDYRDHKVKDRRLHFNDSEDENHEMCVVINEKYRKASRSANDVRSVTVERQESW